ncbi:anhydro-N-acetylmuramic acid kinase [Iodidimonas muriae]|uniref:Anhydro-N-acetylmuramic acid kinase n=1 Tax=Iodidimonas muriae TaxID=261467 RepID=A0ABQ2LEE8_9PROT|nr:anhydro-N-acetylmuramic acid kinase [Iodidimonas muriae]GGO13350.1 anhydro-N-acetylmuramic acid kinase [Iodidimonas muriae]
MADRAGRAKPYLALGLMSGTSRDGIDAALVRTDGRHFVEPGETLFLPYDSAFRAQLAQAVEKARLYGMEAAADLRDVEKSLTDFHAKAVDALIEKAVLNPEAIDLIGFHGHTVYHAPQQQLTWQLGDGQALCDTTGIAVVGDFRSNDVAQGGEGAPLAPAYHKARLSNDDRCCPAVVLNIGGVSNVTWIGADEEPLLSFDCGPGNALIDDWILAETGYAFDEGGKIAGAGDVDENIVLQLMSDSFFMQNPPKSLDRDAFASEGVRGLSTEDGAATLTAFTLEAIKAAQEHFPRPPQCWYVTGGGRFNETLMDGLRQQLHGHVTTVESLGWNGDFLEAEAFAYLAVRSVENLPLSWPGTTGVSKPVTGGQLFRPRLK